MVIFHPGGPGIEARSALLTSIPDIDYDDSVVVAWDGATSLRRKGACGPHSVAYGVQIPTDWRRAALAVGAECVPGPLTETTWAGTVSDAAEELEAIRTALGVRRIDLLTHSFGTVIAEMYLARYGRHVRRAVLDGPVVMDASWRQRVHVVSRAIARSLRDLLGACASTLCSDRVRQVVENHETSTYASLRNALVTANARVGSGKQTLTGTMVDRATLAVFSDHRLWGVYARGLNRAFQRDGRILWDLGERAYFGLDRSRYLTGLCSSIEHPPTVGAYVSADPLVNTFVKDLAPCAAMPAEQLPRRHPAVAGPQLLVAASVHDPLTPWGLVRLADWPPGALLCRTETRGHTGAGSPRTSALVRRFLSASEAELSFHDFGCQPSSPHKR